MPEVESTKAASRWATRIIPLVLAAAVGYGTYVIVVHVCVRYLLSPRHEDEAVAIVILVLHFIFLLFMIATYLRTYLTIAFDCGVVPLGPLAVERQRKHRRKRKNSHPPGDLEGHAYHAGPDLDPDSPGLEQFYTKDVFVCESDGRPKWCSECCNWKPDRVHHSSEIARCVYRMDHYCPWVGGMVGENCRKPPSLRHLVAGIAIAAFFGIFNFLMTVTSMRYVFLNMTNVDMLGARRKVHQLAVRVPHGPRSTDSFTTVTYPLPKLELGINGEANRRSRPRATDNSGPGGRANGASPDPRDDLATRTFAILKTEPGENPWHLGYWENWKSVMGTNFIDWLLPIRKSPCANHENGESFYPMGPVLVDIRARYGLSRNVAEGGAGLEMRQIGSQRA
ncbi:hypothetical protein DL766_008909 [Monosporascus sp. MC13-8B]|uniref:Palmitoyltransferase n=1 Tax=Monosporascus cannonballus TaxID=155416 RepID=A0ABY0GUS8_9PEZI|nr:hypothetical protein DL762_009104 [Monosporascus cannonballus]RYO88636.1 hypothetical protein DL763_005910 [Monosporascus cannonballus]RYP17385.1 hypothetical protein DL766_008909 [Monosporascus sp. MC13-8B]